MVSDTLGYRLPMAFTQISVENMNSPYAEQLGRGFRRLRFRNDLEREFREFYTARSAPRGRIAGIVALILVLGAAAADALTGRLTGGFLIPLVNVGILCPLLTLFVIALHLRRLGTNYSIVASAGVAAIGLVISYVSVRVAADGVSYMFAGVLLVSMYSGPLLGLYFYHRVVLMMTLAAGYVVLALALGLGLPETLHTTAMYGAAVLISTYLSYNGEHALRRHYLETRLLNELAERDGLTGLYNRRIFDSFMRRVWRQSRRDESALQIMMIDIDHFKIYNDLYGHQSGDETLQSVARCISRYAKRPFDFCARYGGEEFVLVIYGAPGDFPQPVAEQILKDVMDLEIEHEGSDVADRVTVSIGVAVARPSSARSLAGAIQAADEALYQAKRAGRNRIVSKDANINEVETGKFRAAYKELV
ncbi:MAG TPA: GGDEF domain-containing protein [Gammaproteobacteria bacterium]|nr:GGDEF domain-containing protein [Gammaproteobacteria bacterium]